LDVVEIIQVYVCDIVQVQTEVRKNEDKKAKNYLYKK
jgi:hypothetical protein